MIVKYYFLHILIVTVTTSYLKNEHNKTILPEFLTLFKNISLSKNGIHKHISRIKSISSEESRIDNVSMDFATENELTFAKMSTQQTVTEKSNKRTPVKLTMKQGLLMNQVLNFYVLDNPEGDLCKKHSEEFRNGLRAFEPWALKMFDSSSKLQSGILLGNLFEFGSYLQCLEIYRDTVHGPIYGKLCTLKITPSLNLIKKILTFRNVSDHRFNIIQIIVEKSELGWSVCVPHTCMKDDILHHFKKRLSEMSEGLELTVSIDEHYCNTIFDKPKFNKLQYIVLIFLSSFIVLSLGSAFVDYTSNREEKHSIVIIFSAYTNYKKLISKGIVQPEYSFLHGLKFISTCYVVLGHRYIMFMVDPGINSLSILDWLLEYPSSIILGSTVSVDSFFMISGMLLSIGFFDHVSKTGKFNLFLFYIHRYLRITAPLAIIVLIWCTLVQFLGNGTLMYDVYINHQKHCQEYWWSTLLHIQSYINPGEWCNYPIWYLSCEMPFYYFSPILLYPLWKWPTLGIINCSVIYLLSLGLSFYLAWRNKYTGDMLPITGQLLVTDYFKYYYTQPHVRVSPYILGIIFGYFIFKTRNKTIKVNTMVNISLWTISLTIMITTILGSRTFQRENHIFNVWESSSYLAFSRNAWSISLIWIIWACLKGYGGIVNDVLSAHIFRILSRLSYSIFLLHTMIQLSMGGNMKVPIYFSNFYAIYYAVADITIITMVGLIFTVFFEIPLVRAENIMFNPKRKSKKIVDVKPPEKI